MLSYAEVKNSKPETLTALAKAWSGVADTHTDAAGQFETQATERLWGGSLDGHSIQAAHGRSEQLQTQIKAGATISRASSRISPVRSRGREVSWPHWSARPGTRAWMSVAPGW